jgi:GxxExxY protein
MGGLGDGFCFSPANWLVPSSHSVSPQLAQVMESSLSWHDELTQSVIACALQVHNMLGPGFAERIYRRALVIELRKQNISIEIEKDVPTHYDQRIIGRHRLDLVVDHQLIIELKTADSLSKVHYAQVKSYLKATGLHRALLINFATERADIRRIQLAK